MASRFSAATSRRRSGPGACGRVWRSGRKRARSLRRSAMRAGHSPSRPLNSSTASPAPGAARRRGSAPGPGWRPPRAPASSDGLVEEQPRRGDGHAALSLEHTARARLHRHPGAAAGWRGCPRAGGPTRCWRGFDRPIGVLAAGAARLLGLRPGRAGLGGGAAAGAAVRRRRRRHARRRLRGERPLGPRPRPPGGAHARPAAGRRHGDARRRRWSSSRRSAASGWRCWCSSTARRSLLGVCSAAADRALSAGQAGDELAAGDARPDLLLGGADRHGGGDRRARRRRPSRSGPRPSSGSSATTRSTRTRTARTTRWSASAARRCVLGSADAALPRRLLRARCSLLLALAGWLAGLSWPGSGRRCCCRRRCWRGRWRRSTSTTRRAASGCSRRTARSGWRWRWPSWPAGCERRGGLPARPHRHRPRRRWCRRSRCTSPPRSRRSGRRPRPGWSGKAIAPPFWAFAWPGSMAMARLILDRPALVAGKRVLDFAAGCGLAAIAAARGRGGARGGGGDRPARHRRHPLERRAERGGGRGAGRATWSASPAAGTVVLAGDVCYEAPMAAPHPALAARPGRGRCRGLAGRSRPRLCAERAASNRWRGFRCRSRGSWRTATCAR